MEQDFEKKKSKKRRWLLIPFLAVILAAGFFSMHRGWFDGLGRAPFLQNAHSKFNGGPAAPFGNNQNKAFQKGDRQDGLSQNGLARNSFSQNGPSLNHPFFGNRDMNGSQSQFAKGFGHGPMDRGFHGREHHGFGLFGWMLAAAIFFLGWFLRKFSGNSLLKKWTGWLLMLIGLVMIFKVFLLAAAAVILIVWLFKKWKITNKNDSWDIPVSFQVATGTINTDADKLDEWERNLFKEEN